MWIGEPSDVPEIIELICRGLFNLSLIEVAVFCLEKAVGHDTEYYCSGPLDRQRLRGCMHDEREAPLGG